MATTGLLLIADITGYTGYLRDSELDHAQSILSDLLGLLVDRTTPPLVVSRLEGDAVIAHAVDGGFLSGQTFVEHLEGTYVAFRRALQLMIINTTCQCRACANIATLDLKFFVHHGEYAFQDIGGHHELVGSDVNVVHRLVKNQVTERTGVRAYTLHTAAAVGHLAVDPVAAGWSRTVVETPDVGDVVAWVEDMHPVWERAQDRSTIEFTDRDIVLDVAADVGLPPPIVWDYIADPRFRAVLMAAERQTPTDLVAGRIDEGSTFVCVHGEGKITRQLVVEWRPFLRMVTLDRPPLPGPATSIHCELTLEPIEGGTRLRQVLARPIGPAPMRFLVRRVLSRQVAEFQRDIDSFAVTIEADHAARGAGQSGRQSPTVTS